MEPDSRVVELPDGSGDASVFLSTLHPEWRAADHLTLLVESVDAEQLAVWAMLLLGKRLAPLLGSIIRVTREGEMVAARGATLALVYNPVPWLAAPARLPRRAPGHPVAHALNGQAEAGEAGGTMIETRGTLSGAASVGAPLSAGPAGPNGHSGDGRRAGALPLGRLPAGWR